MALLGEEVVEEWLNRKGYFTIRGIKLGVHEIDILAIKPKGSEGYDCRHIEVQLSVNPISYISRVPKEVQKAKGISTNSARKRDDLQLKQGIAEWIKKKFDHDGKADLRDKLCPGKWSKELVLNEVKYPEEIGFFEEQGIKVHRLNNIVQEMKEDCVVASAAGADLFNLMFLKPNPLQAKSIRPE